MTDKALATTTPADLVRIDALPLDRHPAAVYLASLSEGSRRTMCGALDTIADLVSGGDVDALGLDWSALRFQHTMAIRSKLAETYAPATANKMLSALRGVLKAAHQLGQIDAEVASDLAKNAAIIIQGLHQVQMIINGQLETDLPPAASSVVLSPNVRLLLAQYDWDKVTPGTLELPPGSIDWWLITTV